MEQVNRRYQQPRSNSISGHDFHLTNGYARPGKANSLAQQSPFNDSLFYPQSDRTWHNVHHHQQQQHQIQRSHNQSLSRSQSPYGLEAPANLSHEFHSNPIPSRPVRNQLHASLEYLNTGYLEQAPAQHAVPSFHSSSRFQPSLKSNQAQQHLFKPQPNQHYAASYVLTPAPAETLINPNSGQDLAAAAMGIPQNSLQQQQSNQLAYSAPPKQPLAGIANNNPNNSINVYLAQNLLYNRNLVNASPLHRRLNFQAATAGNTPVTTTTAQAQTPVDGPMSHHPQAGQSSSSSSIRPGYSSLSLASSTFLIEDKLKNEIKKLQTELGSEKEKNEALNSQLNINSNLMAAFEQSLTTLNSRLRQLTATNEDKERELEELKTKLENCKLNPSQCNTSEQGTSPIGDPSQLNYVPNTNNEHQKQNVCPTSPSGVRAPSRSELMICGADKESEQSLVRIIDDLKRQLIEKDRLLTDTRLEALSAAHQLEQLESKLNGDPGMRPNEDDIEDGVVLINHSPSDSDAITDSAQYNEPSSGPRDFVGNNNQQHHNNIGICNSGMSNNSSEGANDLQDQSHHSNNDNQSNLSSSDYHTDEKEHTNIGSLSRSPIAIEESFTANNLGAASTQNLAR